MKVLIPFVITFLGETLFSGVAVMKTIYEFRLIIEKELRVTSVLYSYSFAMLRKNEQNALKMKFVDWRQCADVILEGGITA
jgi:uncharacterized membrane protein